jgi:hypothetical protein
MERTLSFLTSSSESEESLELELELEEEEELLLDSSCFLFLVRFFFFLFFLFFLLLVESTFSSSSTPSCSLMRGGRVRVELFTSLPASPDITCLLLLCRVTLEKIKHIGEDKHRSIPRRQGNDCLRELYQCKFLTYSVSMTVRAKIGVCRTNVLCFGPQRFPVRYRNA